MQSSLNRKRIETVWTLLYWGRMLLKLASSWTMHISNWDLTHWSGKPSTGDTFNRSGSIFMDFKFSQRSDCSELLCKSAGEQEQEEAQTIIILKKKGFCWDQLGYWSSGSFIRTGWHFTIIDLDSIFFLISHVTGISKSLVTFITKSPLTLIKSLKVLHSGLPLFQTASLGNANVPFAVPGLNVGL